MSDEEEFYDGDGDDDSEDEEEDYDCGMMISPKGRLEGCTLTGSEDCDFECPYRAEFERQMSKQRKARR